MKRRTRRRLGVALMGWSIYVIAFSVAQLVGAPFLAWWPVASVVMILYSAFAPRLIPGEDESR